MSWWIGTSLLAISIKLWLLFAKRIQLRENGALELLLIGFLGMNVIELGGFFSMQNESVLFSLLSLYYMFCTLTVAAMLNLFMSMNGANTAMLRINWVVATVMAATFMVPGLMLLGVQQLGFSATRIPGPMYLYWIVYILATLIFAMVQLATVYLRHRSEQKGKQVLVILLGLSPAVLTSIVIVVMMQLGFKINLGAIISLMICTFLLSLIWAENRHSVFQVLARVPNTEEHRIRTQLHTAFAKIEMSAHAPEANNAGFANSVRDLEKSYRELTGDKTDSRQSQGNSGWLMY